MASEVMARELLAELEASGRGPQSRRRAGLFGGPPVEDLVAYRMGRSAMPVEKHLLAARMQQIDQDFSTILVNLKARHAQIEKQRGDVLVWLGHFLAVMIGLGILGAALTVDYMIIHEFWTRVLANEFGEVPESLATSVIFKSAQVVFATLAFHLMLETVGEIGRRIFILFIFVLTFCMLLGIGLIIANNWLPEGSELFGIDLKEAVRNGGEDVLAALGLATAPEAGAAPGPLSEADVRTAQTMLWLGSLSVIFIVVTGVGSLCMRFAIRGFHGIFGNLTFDTRHGGAAQLGILKDELSKVDVQIDYLNNPRHRSELLRSKLAAFVTSYMEGLRQFQSAWFGLAERWNTRGFGSRSDASRILGQKLEESAESVNEEVCSPQAMERRHGLEQTHRPSTAVDARRDSRIEPPDNVSEFRSRRPTGTDDY